MMRLGSGRFLRTPQSAIWDWGGTRIRSASSAGWASSQECSSNSSGRRLSTSVPIRSVATMGTVECLEELRLFLISLSVMESHSAVVDRISSPLHVLVGTTTAAIARLVAETASGANSNADDDYIRRHGRWLGDAAGAPGHPGTSCLTLPGLVVEFTSLLDRYTVMIESPLRGRDGISGGIGGETHLKPAVIDRSVMERTRGSYFPSVHADFMMEKANLMERCLTLNTPNSPHSHASSQAEPSALSVPLGGESLKGRFGNVLFLDCDILTLAPLPLVPAVSAFGVSPHDIRPMDEALFGRYNGGWVYCADPTSLFLWRAATQRSRYFDQSSLEDVVEWYRSLPPPRKRTDKPEESGLTDDLMSTTFGSSGNLESVVEFPPQHNFGYWRMFQTEGSVDEVVHQFDLIPADEVLQWNLPHHLSHAVGAESTQLIGYQGKPLQSVHTHFTLPSTNKAMPLFNKLVTKWMERAVAVSTSAAASEKKFYHPYIPILEELRRHIK